MHWETVIGLEIHIQLATQSKLFSSSPTQFGAAPNTQANIVDLALPGTLPVPNAEAFRFAALFGLAINAPINQCSVFERKNYFYPDLPKGYQTTQLEEPIIGRGQVEISLQDGRKKTIAIHHAHLEEDAGKSLHDEFSEQTGIDLNRAGTPLIELVTEPDLRSAEEAVACFKKIHSIVRYLGICDGDLSQGSMRCDANVSIRPQGQTELGTRTEIKNINSFRFVEKAINSEVERQINALEDGETLVQETRLYDSEKDETRSMRSKEEANDYRYFPCPDLLPVVLDDAYIEELKAQLPELPEVKMQRFIEHYELSQYDADLLTSSREMADYFEATAEHSNNAKLSANWILGDLSAKLNNAEIEIDESPISSAQLAQLIVRIMDNTLSSKIAKKVFDLLWESDASVDDIIEQHGFKQVSDSSALEAMVDEVIANHSAQVEQYLAADENKRKKMLGFFVGQIMQASKGQANPGMVNQLLKEKLK